MVSVVAMMQDLEQYLTAILGDASALGAQSWLHVFSWIAALFLAAVAGMALRRQSFQSRATLLLSLHERWNEMKSSRASFNKVYKSCRTGVRNNHGNLQEKHQVEHIRNECKEQLGTLRDDNDDKFNDFIEFASFFELVGTYVRNGYLPLRDVIQMYKGPILDLEISSRDFIDTWQKEAHVPPGLFRNALHLMKRTRFLEEHPIWYRILYPYVRYFY